MQVRRLDSQRTLSFGILKSTTWAKLEQNLQRMNAIQQRAESEREFWLPKLSVYMYVGKWVLNVPWPAMILWNQKPQLEKDIDSEKLTGSPSKFLSGPNTSGLHKWYSVGMGSSHAAADGSNYCFTWAKCRCKL